MSELNPYEKYLDGRPIEQILVTTPKALTAALDAIGGERLALAPAPGKWSAAEILCHLADCELVFAFRMRQTVAEDAPTVPPFDQNKWAATYAGIPAAQALSVFIALRQWNLTLVRGVMPGAADRLVTHPQRGTMTFRVLLESVAGHDLNHLGQLHRITAQFA